jgi:hypothetical protein
VRAGKSSGCWARNRSAPVPLAQRRSLLTCNTDG